MSRLVEIVSSTSGKHYILIGLSGSELSSFNLQLWVTKYQIRMVDWVQSMGLNLISFIGGDLWIHNDDTVDRCNLFGEKRDCIVGVVSNEMPNVVKIWDSLGVQSDSAWEVTSITIPPSLNHPQGMTSVLPTAQFKRRDGVWQAKFLRNLKSASGSVSVLDAVQGEELKGSEMYLTLKNTSNDQVKLFALEFNMTKSRV
jgi:hypothetical protein